MGWVVEGGTAVERNMKQLRMQVCRKGDRYRLRLEQPFYNWYGITKVFLLQERFGVI
jgi:hypothetical protein